MDKYFTSNFNLANFAFKCVTHFIYSASWRWIGSNHKAHIHAIEIYKILMEYKLLDADQAETMKNLLYGKIQNLKNLEESIHKEITEKSNDYSAKIWIEGAKKCREFYCEILIHFLYFKQDEEVIKFLITEGKNDSKNSKITNFNKSILFEKEFGKKLIDFILGYVLSQDKVFNFFYKIIIISKFFF